LSRRHNRGRTVAVLGATHATAAERAALRNLGVAVRRVNECASGEALADRVNREADVVVVFGGAKSRYLTNVAIGSGFAVVCCGAAVAGELRSASLASASSPTRSQTRGVVPTLHSRKQHARTASRPPGRASLHYITRSGGRSAARRPEPDTE